MKPASSNSLNSPKLITNAKAAPPAVKKAGTNGQPPAVQNGKAKPVNGAPADGKLKSPNLVKVITKKGDDKENAPGMFIVQK